MVRFVASLLILISSAAFAAAPRAPSIAARAWIVGDLTSGQVLRAEKADERFEPASLTKLMTAYLVFAALRDKKIVLTQQVPVSQRAHRVAGARMFIDPKKPVTVDELIRGMVVQSGNDACMALAEAISGTEDAFVQQMNREAVRLGMKNSHFMNTSGLPDAQHYSTARDLYVLTAALIRDFPAEYAAYYSQKEYRYNNITQPNRNGLLWLDPTVDGVKTGHTEAAGFCLVASSRRHGRRLLSVLLGANSEPGRARESQKLLNWGFQFYEAVKLFGANDIVRELDVWKGSRGTVKVGPKGDLYATVPKGESGKLKAELVSVQPLTAPLAKDQHVGVLRVSFDEKPYAEYPLVALEAVGPAGLLGRGWDTLRLWIKRFF
jgi:serine-type D-Ala-D-Ala carboxypeptidase (penicillin-binding protein 5/6)